MAVDIGDLVESLQREVNPPGQNLYPDTTENDWIGYLADAFWEARLHGMLKEWEVDAAFTVVPVQAGGADIGRDLQQLLVLYAGYRITLIELKNMQSGQHFKAGPVEVEIQRASNVLRAVLDAIKGRINIVLERLSDAGAHTEVYAFDAVIQATNLIASGDGWFVR